MTKKPRRKRKGRLAYQMLDPRSPLSRACPWCGAGIGDLCWDARNLGTVKNVHAQRRAKRSSP